MCSAAHPSFLESNLVGLLTIFIGAAFVVWSTLYTIRKQNQWALAKQRYAIYRKAHDLLVYYTAREVHEGARTAIPPYHDEYGNEFDPKDIRLAIVPLLALPTKMSKGERSEIRELIDKVRDRSGAEEFNNAMLKKLAPELLDEDDGKTA